jgi:hypothetical protein
VSLEFDPVDHVYTLDGLVLQSVTQILKVSGLIDFSHIPERILLAALERGRKVHQAIHYLNENDLDLAQFNSDFPKYAGYVESWRALLSSGRLKTVLCEHRVASRRHRYAGTIDWVGEFDGKGAILDFATGDPEDAAKFLQTAGYDAAAREWANEPGEDVLKDFYQRHRIVERYGVRLKKDGKLPTPERYKDPRNHSEFLALVDARRVVEMYRGEARAWASEAA